MCPDPTLAPVSSTQPQNRLAEPRRLSDMLLYRINRLRSAGGGIVLRLCEGRFGITRREWVVIALLNDEESATPSELAARGELSKPAISKAIGSLLQKGLVTKFMLASDNRFAELRLADAGRQLYREIIPLVEEVNKNLMSFLNLQQISDLDNLISRLEIQATVLADSMSTMPKADRRRGGTQRRMGSSKDSLGGPFNKDL